MKQIFTIGLVSLMAGTFYTADAQEWCLNKELKYSNVDLLIGEEFILHNSQNKPVVRRNDIDRKITLWEYDMRGNITREESRAYNTREDVWALNSRFNYTYNEDNLLETKSSYVLNWQGVFGMNGYYEYEYDEQQKLQKSSYYGDDTKSRLFQTIEYTDYTESGLPGRKSVYNWDPTNGSTLAEYETYVYDEDDLMIELNFFGINYATMDLYHKSKTTYLYEPGVGLTLEVKVNYNATTGANTYESKKEYTYDDASGKVSDCQTYYWSIMDECWLKSVRTGYEYTDALKSTRTPRYLYAEPITNAYHLTWTAPADAEGLTGYNVYVNDRKIASLDASALAYDLTQTEKGANFVYVSSVYGENECNITDRFELENLIITDPIEYAMPTFGDITYAKEENYQITYEMYWHAPETDMEVTGYRVQYNDWPLSEDVVAETTFRCTLRKMLNEVSFGVCAVYADGGESEYHSKSYRLDQLLTSIIQSGAGKDIWAFNGNICVDGNLIRSVEIFNSMGMKVHEQRFNDGINLIKLPADIYIVKATMNEGVTTKKIYVK